MKRKILAIALIMILCAVPGQCFASAGVDIDDDMAVIRTGIGGTAEPQDSRWYREDVVIYKNKIDTQYSLNKLRAVSYIQTKTAVYYVYVGDPSKRRHQFDIYDTTWTGYQRASENDPWQIVPGKVNVHEITHDRSPIEEILGMLI